MYICIVWQLNSMKYYIFSTFDTKHYENYTVKSIYQKV